MWSYTGNLVTDYLKPVMWQKVFCSSFPHFGSSELICFYLLTYIILSRPKLNSLFRVCISDSQLHVHNGNIRGYSNLYNNNTYPCSNGTAVLLKCLQETRNASLCPYILGDYTPKYIIHGEGWKSKSYHSNTDEPKYLIPHKIFSMNKDSKIIFIVRDPTERLFSSYKYFIPLLNKWV